MTFVLGYDDSAAAQDALGVAIDLAARYGEPLVVVYGAAPPGMRGEEFRAHEQALEDLGRAATAVAVQRASDAGVQAQVEVVRESPAQALVEAADRHDARMIVVGTHGERAIMAALMGSTTYRLLHMSSRPVLVVR